MSKAMEKRVQEALDHLKWFGTNDGAHHKQWALDQTVRILTGCTLVNKSYTNPRTLMHYDYTALGESEEYLEWSRSTKESTMWKRSVTSTSGTRGLPHE